MPLPTHLHSVHWKQLAFSYLCHTLWSSVFVHVVPGAWDACLTPHPPRRLTRILLNWAQMQLPLGSFSSNSLSPLLHFTSSTELLPPVLCTPLYPVHPSGAALGLLFCDYDWTVVNSMDFEVRWTRVRIPQVDPDSRLLAAWLWIGYYCNSLRISSLSMNWGIIEPPCKVVKIKRDHACKVPARHLEYRSSQLVAAAVISVIDCLCVCDHVILKSGIVPGSYL